MSQTSAKLKELMLLAPRLTIAAAESMTCGRVQAALGSISGASEYFVGGITAYTIDQKAKHLGVDRAMAQRVNAVSAEVAEAMACGVCRMFGTDLGVATTGYAECPDADKFIHPFAWWALAHRAGRAEKYVALFSGRIECPRASRVEAQTIVADAVMGEVVEYLRGMRAGSRS